MADAGCGEGVGGAGGAPANGHPDGRGAALLELAARLENVSEACRHLGVDRSAYYRARKAARGSTGDTGGGAGPAREAIAARVLGLCLAYPEWGCDRLALYLRLTGSPVSSPTVQKILLRHGLGRAADRFAEARRRKQEGEAEGSG